MQVTSKLDCVGSRINYLWCTGSAHSMGLVWNQEHSSDKQNVTSVRNIWGPAWKLESFAVHECQWFNGVSLVLTAFWQVVDDFEGLPIKFLNFHGSSDLDQVNCFLCQDVDSWVLNCSDHGSHRFLSLSWRLATYNYRQPSGILIYPPRISNWSWFNSIQFMLPRKRGLDKFDQQDAVIEALRKFATEKNVNDEPCLAFRLSSLCAYVRYRLTLSLWSTLVKMTNQLVWICLQYLARRKRLRKQTLSWLCRYNTTSDEFTRHLNCRESKRTGSLFWMWRRTDSMVNWVQFIWNFLLHDVHFTKWILEQYPPTQALCAHRND